mmetsp:Transcript_6926/g.16813  ORF Transcript_6926/g.16813 Transcript_6926/m.16813 type:complete len:196 (+) Transcript_6926:941-1528(+)
MERRTCLPYATLALQAVRTIALDMASVPQMVCVPATRASLARIALTSARTNAQGMGSVSQAPAFVTLDGQVRTVQCLAVAVGTALARMRRVRLWTFVGAIEAGLDRLALWSSFALTPLAMVEVYAWLALALVHLASPVLAVKQRCGRWRINSVSLSRWKRHLASMVALAVVKAAAASAQEMKPGWQWLEAVCSRI